MKKVILGLAFSAYVAVGFMACSKTGCYKCTLVLYEINICDNNVTGAGALNDTAALQVKTATSSSNQNNEGYKAQAEMMGYSCTAQ